MDTSNRNQRVCYGLLAWTPAFRFGQSQVLHGRCHDHHFWELCAFCRVLQAAYKQLAVTLCWHLVGSGLRLCRCLCPSTSQHACAAGIACSAGREQACNAQYDSTPCGQGVCDNERCRVVIRQRGYVCGPGGVCDGSGYATCYPVVSNAHLSSASTALVTAVPKPQRVLWILNRHLEKSTSAWRCLEALHLMLAASTLCKACASAQKLCKGPAWDPSL